MRCVAVLGAQSMLGQALCRQLVAQGIMIIRVGRDHTADIQLNLENEIFVWPEKNYSADVFFHCAASFNGDDELGINQNIKVNANSAPMVTRLAAKLGCRQFIYAGTLSSAADFDPAVYSSYGFSKLLAEQQYAWLLKRAGIAFCALRFTHLYDTEGQCIRHQPWFGRAVTYAAQGAVLHLPEASAKRNFLHVDDAAKMLLAAGKRAVVGVLNAVHPHSLTMLELVQLTYQLFQRGGQYSCDSEKTPFRHLNYPDGNDCWALLDFIPQISLEQTLLQIKQQGLDENFGCLDID